MRSRGNDIAGHERYLCLHNCKRTGFVAFQNRSGPMSHALRLARRAHIPLIVTLAGLMLSGCGVNVIPSYEETAKAKWSDVQNQYQRRADLIPNLVESVKGFARQEREVLEAVVNARARATSIQVTPEVLTNPEAFKKFQEAQTQLSGALGRLLAVSENY